MPSANSETRNPDDPRTGIALLPPFVSDSWKRIPGHSGSECLACSSCRFTWVACACSGSRSSRRPCAAVPSARRHARLGTRSRRVSRHIAALEAEYDIPLLERGATGVRPTPYGERLLEHADAILAHDDQLRREFDGLRKGALGHITVGAFPTAVAGIIPAALSAFQQHRPDTTLSLIEARTPALIEHVHGRDLDVAVVTDGPDGAGCQPAWTVRTCSTNISWWRSDAATGSPAGEPSICAKLPATRSSPAADADENALLRAHRLGRLPATVPDRGRRLDREVRLRCGGHRHRAGPPVGHPGAARGRNGAQAARQAGPVSSRRRHHGRQATTERAYEGVHPPRKASRTSDEPRELIHLG